MINLLVMKSQNVFINCYSKAFCWNIFMNRKKMKWSNQIWKFLLSYSDWENSTKFSWNRQLLGSYTDEIGLDFLLRTGVNSETPALISKLNHVLKVFHDLPYSIEIQYLPCTVCIIVANCYSWNCYSLFSFDPGSYPSQY